MIERFDVPDQAVLHPGEALWRGGLEEKPQSDVDCIADNIWIIKKKKKNQLNKKEHFGVEIALDPLSGSWFSGCRSSPEGVIWFSSHLSLNPADLWAFAPYFSSISARQTVT